MIPEDQFSGALSSEEKEILIALLKEGAVLSFNEKAMVQVFIPGEGLVFITLGDEVIRSLQKRRLISPNDSAAWEVKEFKLSPEGQKVAKNLLQR